MKIDIKLILLRLRYIYDTFNLTIYLKTKGTQQLLPFVVSIQRFASLCSVINDAVCIPELTAG